MADRRLTVVFDLDGTLVATAPDIVKALNAVLAGEGLAPISEDAARDLVSLGAGARVLIENTFRAAGRSIGDSEVEAMLERYLAHYADHICEDSTLYPDCREALGRLQARGDLLAVCTNKPERHSRLLLQALGLAPLFGAIAGKDTFPFNKPDGRHLTETIVRAGGDPSHAVLVGDSQVDVATARAAGVPVIGVSFGYTTVPMAALRPDAVIDGHAELVEAIDRVHPLSRPSG